MEAAIVNVSFAAGFFMYAVYLNKNELLVVPKSCKIPSELGGAWQKKRRIVRSVSEVIRKDIELHGFHRRRRGDIVIAIGRLRSPK
jgi:hypothetical protein